MHPRLLTLGLACTLLLTATWAQAFDDQRQGFALGLGVGLGSARRTIDATAGGLSASLSNDHGGFATALRLGGGLNDRWLLCYTSQVVFFSPDGSDVRFAQGIGAISALYFLQPQAPSLFFEAGLGQGALVDVDRNESDTGIGLLLGLGYEVSRHWEFGMSFSYAKVGEDTVDGFDLDASISTVQVTVGWLGY
ncbi:MAG: hypothetical protein R3D98_06070 [Candidatus Krumholzibacteriia bacterium]